MKAVILRESLGSSQIQASYLIDGNSHRWLVPAAAMEVCLDAEALGGLARDLAVIRRRARPGEEIGGLLVGSRDFIGRNSVRIAAIETYAATALHQLLGLMSVRAAEQRRNQTGGTSVVGWYRIAAGDEAGISREDEALMRMHFPDPGSVLLVLRPSELHLVFWRGNELKIAVTEFPALPVLLAGPEGGAGQPARPPRKRPGEWWKLAGISLATAILVFTAGVLWNQASSGRAPGGRGAGGRSAVGRALGAQRELAPMLSSAGSVPRRLALQAPDVSGATGRGAGDSGRTAQAQTGLRPYGPAETKPAGGTNPNEAERRVWSAPAPKAVEQPVLPPPDLAVASAPEPPIRELPLPMDDRPPQPRPPGPVSAPVRQAAPAAPRFMPAIILRKIKPVLVPGLAKQVKRPITVQVRLTIDATGNVVDAEAVHVTGELEAALARTAVDAGRHWKFEPALMGGRPILSTTNIEFNFQPGH